MSLSAWNVVRGSQAFLIGPGPERRQEVENAQGEEVLYIEENGVAKLTLNRPDKMNSLNDTMRAAILSALEKAATSESVRVVTITGAGKIFCAGGDVKQMAGEIVENESRGGRGRIFKDSSPLPVILISQMNKPVIAAINGVAAGGGFDLACACDIRIASDKARFAELYVRRGSMPAMGGTYFLPHLVGIDRACLLAWTGNMIDAKEAERIGLVTMVVPHEELELATTDLAEKLAKGPPIAIQSIKRAIYDCLSMSMEDSFKYIEPLVERVRQTEDHKEGVNAFLEKREPVFRGK